MNPLLARIVIVTVSAAVMIIIFEILMFWLRKIVTLKTNRQNIRRVINIFRLIFYTFIVIVELGVWGVNLVAILAGAGFLGIILGLALQVPLGNFFSGVYVVLSRIVKEGDEISVNAVGSNILITGMVKHVGFSHTELLDKEGKLNIVPNNVIVSSILKRLNVREKRRFHH